MTQFVQGFAKNILDEKNWDIREHMIQYLGDLMEDASDFSWVSAKASHAVMLCEMERGKITWSDTTRIDRIRRAHAQKHQNKANWGNKMGEKHPWFCKNFQTGTCSYSRDHETGGKLQKHIGAFCLTQGRVSNHAEKDCQMVKKQQAKNDQTAAHL